MKLSPVSIALGLALAACGGEDAPETTTPELAIAPQDIPMPSVAEVAPTALPPVIAAEPAALVELPHEVVTFELEHGEGSYDQVAYAAPIQRAIDQAMRAIMRTRMENFDYEGPNSENPSHFSFDCTVTLAVETWVAYTCIARTSEGRGGGGAELSSHAWEVGPALREIALDDLLVAGTYGEDAPMAPTAAGIAVVASEGASEVTPYEALGRLLNMDSVLARIPRAVRAATEETALFREIGPPSTVDVVIPGQPFAHAVLQAAHLGARWLFAEQGAAPIGVDTALVMNAPSDSQGQRLTTAERDWSTPARLGVLRLKRSAQLRTAPGGPGRGVTLPANTIVYAVLGELSAGASRTGGGQWTLVVASEALVGWLPSGLLEGAVDHESTRSVNAFLQGLPEAERTTALPTAMAVRIEESPNVSGVLAYAPLATRSLVGFLPLVHPQFEPVLRVWLEHEGALVDAHLIRPMGYDGDYVLLVAWLLPSDPTHHQWEAYTMPTDGLHAHEPAFALTLALPTAPSSARVRVATDLTRHGVSYPFVVRGPGRLETLYTWNGTTLVATAEAPPH